MTGDESIIQTEPPEARAVADSPVDAAGVAMPESPDSSASDLATDHDDRAADAIPVGGEPVEGGPVGDSAADDEPAGDETFEDDLAEDEFAEDESVEDESVNDEHVEDPADEGGTDFDDPDTDEADDDSDAIRRRLVAQFEAWLDRMDEGERPPDGLPEELLADALEAAEPLDSVGSDLYTVFAGLTKLSGEIGLQGRAFKQLADTLAPTAQMPGRLDRIEAAQNAVARELARRSEPDKSELPASQDVLDVLFDLYDRLGRGLKTFDASYDALQSRVGSGGFLQRLLGGKDQAAALADSVAAMRETYRLTLSRLEAAFVQWGVGRIGEAGQTFDPRQMEVVEVGSAAGVPDGSVMEVYRSGYLLNGRLLRAARVKVAKA